MSLLTEYDVPLVANSDKTRESEEIAQPEEVILTSDRHNDKILTSQLSLTVHTGELSTNENDQPSKDIPQNEEERERATTTATIQATWGQNASEWSQAMVAGWFQFYKLDNLYHSFGTLHENVNGITLKNMFEIKQKNYDFYKAQYTSQFESDQGTLSKDFTRFNDLLDRYFTTDKYTHQFDVAFSFPGDIRDRVEKIATKLCTKITNKQRIFYDNYYKAELARPDLDLYLQHIYRYKTRLIVVFMCADYGRKEWCGLEARVIRDLIKTHQGHRIMLLSTDGGIIDGILSIDGYMDIRNDNDDEVANSIYSRLLALGDPLLQSQILYQPPFQSPERITTKVIDILQNTVRSISPWYIVIALVAYIIGINTGR